MSSYTVFILSYCTAFVGVAVSPVRCGPASALLTAEQHDDRWPTTKRQPPRGPSGASDVTAGIVSRIRSRVAAGSTDGGRKATGWPPTSLIDAIAETLRRAVSTGSGDDEECVERIVNLVREALQVRRNVEYENTVRTKGRPATKCQPKAERPRTTNATAAYHTSCSCTTTTRKGTGCRTAKATITSTASTCTPEPMELTEFGFDNIQPNLVDLVNGYMV